MVNVINKISKKNKIIVLLLAIILVAIISIIVPSLARFKNRTSLTDAVEWDGISVASSFRSGTGTENDPYIISNGSELAFLSDSLVSNNYENTYFKLNNSIIINKGIFKYDDTNKITYTIDDIVYYVDETSNKYYNSTDFTGEEVGTINIINSLNNFKGTFIGNSNTIYGFYLSNISANELALFTNLNGSVSDLYLENEMIYGGNITGGLVGKANSSIISNVLVTGFVIGNDSIKTNSENVNIDDAIYNVTSSSTNNTLVIPNNAINGMITSSTLTGICTVNDSVNTNISINGITGCNGSFTINLGTNLTNSIIITGINNVNSDTVSLTDLSYNYNYETAISSGVVAISDNSIIDKLINKATIYGKKNASGVIGLLTNNSTINNSYNIGSIYSDNYASGLINIVANNSNYLIINNCYNNGPIAASNKAGLFGIFDSNNSVTLNNLFDTSDSLTEIFNQNNSNIVFNNSYYTNGTINNNGTRNETTLISFGDKTFMSNIMLYGEYVNQDYLKDNTNNIWVYDNEMIPVLYIDDINDPIANIHASTYTWNNYSDELDNKEINSNIVFSIEQIDNTRPLTSIEYLISNTTKKMNQLNSSDWTEYTSPVTISEDGVYIIYARVNGSYYLNSDILIKDINGPTVNITLGNNQWNTFKTSLDSVYVSGDTNVTLDSNDLLSGVKSVEYYISSEVLDNTALEAITNWTNYSSSISVTNPGKNIIYIKAIDNNDNVSYTNTDFIVIGGYSLDSIGLGNNNVTINDNSYVTNRSKIVLNYSYTDESTYEDDYTHYLVTSTSLPIGTRLLLVDKKNGMLYQYKINSLITNIPLTLFNKVGMSSNGNMFNENDYLSSASIDEDMSLIIDLSSTLINLNIDNVLIRLELHDGENNVVRPMIDSSNKTFSIYSNINGENTLPTLSISSDNNDSIIFNSDSINNINVTNILTNKTYNGNEIKDSFYENSKLGITIKLLDSSDNIVSRNHYKNVLFEYNGLNYYPESDNITRIKLSNNVSTINSEIKITTCTDNIDLPSGNYKFVINRYTSQDGIYSDELSSDFITIPVVITNNNEIKDNYNFDVLMDDTNRIIDSSNLISNIDFNVIESGLLTNPNIRVSLYRKNIIDSSDQGYTRVDLASYIYNSLETSDTNVYYVSENPIEYDGTNGTYNSFTLQFNTTTFDHTGYKLVFDLYDGDNKIGSIYKTFIIK